MDFANFILFAVLFYFLHVFSSTMGILIADRLNIGELYFDPGSDLKRMAIVSIISLPVPMAIFYFAPSAGAIIIYLLIFFIGCKIAYLGITVPELGIVALTNMLGMGIFRIIIVSKFLIILFLIGIILALILILNSHVKQKKSLARRMAFEKGRKAEIQKILEKDPEFRTICSQCRFFGLEENICIHPLADEIEDYKIARNGLPITFCLYWKL